MPAVDTMNLMNCLDEQAAKRPSTILARKTLSTDTQRERKL